MRDYGFEWWKDALAAHETEGRNDADKGIYSLPYPNFYDPSDEDENAAYERGFKARRKELTGADAEALEVAVEDVTAMGAGAGTVK